MTRYTLTLTSQQRSTLIATLKIQNERLEDYLQAFNREDDEAERGRIHADIAENTDLIAHLKSAEVTL